MRFRAFISQNKVSFIYIFAILILAGFSSLAHAIEYTPLIDSSFLDGPKADVQTAAISFLAVVASIAGVGLIIKVLTR